MSIEKWIIHKVLKHAVRRGGLRVRYWDGAEISYGPEPSITLQIKTLAAARSILLSGSAGLGESYAQGQIEIEGPPGLLSRIVHENISHAPWLEFGSHFFVPRRSNNRLTQQDQIRHHYDLGNPFYRLWLDESMTYSCAYFRHHNDSLEQAQEQKRLHILKKLSLAGGMTLLDIGSGWGHLLFTAARQYSVKGFGITLSKEQLEYSQARARELGLENQVRFELINYQDLADTSCQFERIVSVGMFEHVGRGNHRRYFDAVRRLLTPDGLSVLHTISFDREYATNPWIDRYIFPGGYIPSTREIIAALPDFDLRFLDYENLGMHYALTLDEWLRRFEKNADEVRKMYDEHFVRMWRLYLALSAESFRCGMAGLSQFVMAAPQYVAPLTREHIYAGAPAFTGSFGFNRPATYPTTSGVGATP